MSIWFHGTDKAGYEGITKNGFRSRTYFSKHLETALVMGGKYVFWVWFEKNPTIDWQYISKKRVSKSQILLARKYATHRLYQNDKLAEKINYHNAIEHFGANIKRCKACKGKGEMNNREWDMPAKEHGGYGKACSKCGGFGCLTLDGKKMNEEPVNE